MENITFTTEEKGKQICKRLDENKIIYVYDKSYICCDTCDKMKCKKKACCNNCSLDYHHLKGGVIEDDFIKQLLKQYKPESKKYKNILRAIIPDTQPEVSEKTIKRIDAPMILVPTNVLTHPDLLFIVGARGSGKSFFLNSYVKQFKSFYKNALIYLISAKKEDHLLDKYVLRIATEPEKFIAADFKYDDFEPGSLIIFDDVDSFEGEMQKAAYGLMKDVIDCARSRPLFCAITSHLSANSSMTKNQNNSCTHFVFFPLSSTHQTSYVLKNYFGFDTKTVKKLLALPSRWVCIIRNIPIIILTEHGVFFKSELDTMEI